MNMCNKGTDVVKDRLCLRAIGHVEGRLKMGQFVRMVKERENIQYSPGNEEHVS